MSRKVACDSAVHKQAGIRLPLYARAVIFGIAWLPAVFLVALFVPKFEVLFSRLRDRVELPTLTEWLLWFSWLDRALFFLPCVLVFVLLVVADAGVAGSLRRSERERAYWVWFAGVVVMGFLTPVIAITALLLPILEMNTSI